MSDAEETVRGEVVDEPRPAGAEPAGGVPYSAEPEVAETAEEAQLSDDPVDPADRGEEQDAADAPADEPDYHDRWLRDEPVQIQHRQERGQCHHSRLIQPDSKLHSHALPSKASPRAADCHIDWVK